MKKEQILSKLRELKPILKERFGIEEFALFGSVARDEATKTSDIDIAILKTSKKDFGLLLEAENFLSNQLKTKVDLGYFHSMKTLLRHYISQEMIYVYS